MARSNLKGAKHIAATLPGVAGRNADPCIQFLLGWAAEGLLKTFLSAKGAQTGELLGIGHDLRVALTRAEEEGLERPTASLGFVVDTLAPSHLDMHWRYLPTWPDGSHPTFNLVMPAVAFPALDALDRAVWPLVTNEMNLELRALELPPVTE